MPNIITHTIFAKEVVQQISNPSFIELVRKYYRLLLIGTNGPDYLFFYTDFKCLKRHDITVNNIGSQLHKTAINQQYASFLETYHKEDDPSVKKQMAVYISGHFLHWVLDSTMHPYVVYVSGDDKTYAKICHHELESDLDALLLEEKYHQNIKQFKTYQICNSSNQEKDIIAKVYQPMVNATLGANFDKAIYKKALKDWRNAQKLLYSPKGIKKNLARKLEKTPGLLSSMLVPNQYHDVVDIMNRQHRMWRNPVSGEVFYLSVDDLWEQALSKALNGLNILLKAFEDKQAIKELENFIADKTYANGVSGEQKRRYRQCIYPLK